MSKLIRKLICKVLGHLFYNATSQCDTIRCERCEEWMDSNRAFGVWI